MIHSGHDLRHYREGVNWRHGYICAKCFARWSAGIGECPSRIETSPLCEAITFDDAAPEIQEAEGGELSRVRGPMPVTREGVMDFRARLGILLHDTEKPSLVLTQQIEVVCLSLALLDAVMAGTKLGSRTQANLAPSRVRTGFEGSRDGEVSLT